jgi:hypothetical protein
MEIGSAIPRSEAKGFRYRDVVYEIPSHFTWVEDSIDAYHVLLPLWHLLYLCPATSLPDLLHWLLS